ncbi:hypothetical protein ACIHFB_06795 [Streptomyces sp. NPDC051963]|uniref:hypothetical protein n=1 Tax=Streptomyces sp. NPDC051963 TaxID=3365678 RepID=UPI0037D949F8
MTLAPPFRASVPWLDDAIAELEADGYAPHQPETQPAHSWDNPPWNPTEVTIRIRDYVTREFEEGVAGNRDSLPSTYDVAKACIRGAGNAKSCRLATRHLRLLAMVGEVTRIRDPEDKRWHHTFWALPDSGREVGDSSIPLAVAVSGLPRNVVMRGSQIDHRGCDHPLTRADRERCRREWMYMDVSDL